MATDPNTTPATSKDVVIAGVTFTLSTPFVEGHVTTAAEAKTLNQVRCENIRNNQAKAVKAAADEDGTYSKDALKALAKAVAAYDAEYVFTMASGGARVTDPLEKEAISIARSMVTAKLKDSGIAVKDYDKEKLAIVIAKTAEREDVIALAKKRLAERKALASTEIEL